MELITCSKWLHMRAGKCINLCMQRHCQAQLQMDANTDTAPGG